MSQYKFKVGDLVQYTDQMMFHNLGPNRVGVIVEILNLKEEWKRLEKETDPEYAKGFLEELRMYYALRDLEVEPDVYLNERVKHLEVMLGKAMSYDETETEPEPEILVRVVWTNGQAYVEHPDDLEVVIRIEEPPESD